MGSTYTPVNPNTTPPDIFAVKLNSNGSVLWQRTYGDPKRSEDLVIDGAGGVARLGNDVIIVGATTQPISGGQYYLWVLRLNGANGDIVHSRLFRPSSGFFGFVHCTLPNECTAIPGSPRGVPIKGGIDVVTEGDETNSLHLFLLLGNSPDRAKHKQRCNGNYTICRPSIFT